jgi:hypothetical protein
MLGMCLWLTTLAAKSAEPVDPRQLDPGQRQQIANLIQQHATWAATRLANPETFEYLRKTPDQILPSQVTATLAASGLVCVELGRGFLSKSAADPIEFEAQLQHLQTLVSELVRQDVKISEVRLVFNGQPADFYFPAIAQQQARPDTPPEPCAP